MNFFCYYVKQWSSVFTFICIVAHNYKHGQVNAIRPDATIAIRLNGEDIAKELLFASSRLAEWGGLFKKGSFASYLPTIEATEPTGCNSTALLEDLTGKPGSVVLVERGSCPFLEKALNAQTAGAIAIVIRNSKKAIQRYDFDRGNRSASETFAFSCENGESFLQSLDSPSWSTDDQECNEQVSCRSRTCISTGLYSIPLGGHQICCMWDKLMLMGANRTEASSVSIPVLFTTSTDGSFLRDLIISSTVSIRISGIVEAPFEPSGLLLWLLGVLTTTSAAYYSAGRERRSCALVSSGATGADGSAEEKSGQELEQDSVELEWRHAVGFLISSSAFLVILYYVHVGIVMPIMYALTSIGSVSFVVLQPLLEKWFPSTGSNVVHIPRFGAMLVSEVSSLVIAAGLAVTWMVTRRDSCAWVLQDVFGVCLCFVLLTVVRLPNLKIATLLLSLAFVYDIFFVFLSPMIFGTSVMIEVARGGATSESKEGYPGIDFCERYPNDDRCEEPEPMPALLMIPRLMGDGMSLLGLGDIVIPGLLVAFCIRYDYARWGSIRNGYYLRVSIAYAIGLLVASCAVYIFETGQPALLYLSPMTLLVVCLFAWRNGEFSLLWNGPECMKPKAKSSKSPHADFSKTRSAPSSPTLHDDKPLLRVFN